MSVVTYRGVKYDTSTPKTLSYLWHQKVDNQDHVYRGQHYRPEDLHKEQVK